MAFERNGTCRDSSFCIYAHGFKELRSAEVQIGRAVPPAPEEVPAVENKRHNSPKSFKVKKDKNTGSGDDSTEPCPIQIFGHVSCTPTVPNWNERILEEAYRVLADPEIKSVPKHPVASNFSRVPRNELRNTRMCKFYQQGIKCKYGNKCRYAHSTRDLQVDFGILEESELQYMEETQADRPIVCLKAALDEASSTYAADQAWCQIAQDPIRTTFIDVDLPT